METSIIKDNTVSWSSYLIMGFSILGYIIFIIRPAPPKVEWEYTGFTLTSVRPSVRPSVHMSVDKASGIFSKKLLAQFISYLEVTLIGCVYCPIFILVFLGSISALWRPNIWPELFENNIGSIHFIPGSYLMGVSLLSSIFVFLSSIWAPRWPNVWPETTKM